MRLASIEYAAGAGGRAVKPGVPVRAPSLSPAASAPADLAARAERDAEPSEEALVAATKRGDPVAFDALVGRHLSRAFAVAYRLLGQREDAEDVVQEAFLAALVKIDSFESGRPFSPWLLRIVANRAINLRKARTLRQADEIPADARSLEASPFDEAARSELRAVLQHALAALPEPQRWIVQLFELDGFTGPEIAQMLDMAEGTVRWHLHEGRRALRAALSRSG